MVSEVEMRDEVQIIPISAITVENPRERSEKTFRALIDSIGRVGLKKPITVARVDEEAGVSYRLVCGQGRMEAYVALGETQIPAIVVDASEPERLLSSVIENIARRQQRPLELLQDIAILRDRGYSDHQIADKTGLSLAYVHEIGELIANGRTHDEICREIGADALVFQKLAALKASISALQPTLSHFDCSCFDGEYVTGDVTAEYLDLIEYARLSRMATPGDAGESRQLNPAG